MLRYLSFQITTIERICYFKYFMNQHAFKE